IPAGEFGQPVVGNHIRPDLRRAQMAGAHRGKLNTTALYTRVATSMIRKVMSPLDRLSLLERKKA
ncbi:MAG: hypothetical protein ACLPWS_16280, partial [Rhodomicrobium sp.]